MRPVFLLLLPLVLLPAAAPAQRLELSLTPHVDVVRTGAFYEGPILTGGAFFGGPTLFTKGWVRLASSTAWGARLTARPAGSPWALELDGATATTYVRASGSGDFGASFRLRGIPARLSTFALGATRPLVAVRGARVSGRVAGSLASTTFVLRRFVYSGPSTGGIGYEYPAETAAWSRRYVSPGGEAGLLVAFPFRARFAVTAGATAGVARNETGDFATDRRSVASSRREESHLMPYSRLSLGVGVTR